MAILAMPEHGQDARGMTGNNPHVEAKEEKSCWEPRAKKDVINEGRTDYVHESKGSTDTMTNKYSGFCSWLAPFFAKMGGNRPGILVEDAEMGRELGRKCRAHSMCAG